MIQQTDRVTVLVLFRIIATLVPSSADADQSIDRWYRSEVAAVAAAADRYNPISIREDREFMGAIFRHADCYSFTADAGLRGSGRVTVKIAIPRAAEVVAFWHTHGATESTNQYFSKGDLRLVRRWQKPFYLADYTGLLKVLRPGQPARSIVRVDNLWRHGVVGQVIHDADGEPLRIATLGPRNGRNLAYSANEASAGRSVELIAR